MIKTSKIFNHIEYKFASFIIFNKYCPRYHKYDTFIVVSSKIKKMSEDPPFVTPFGTLLGEYQGVEGFSNGSDHHFSGEQHILNGITTGIKYT